MIICWMSDSVMSPVSVFAHCYVVGAEGEGGNRVTLGDSDVVDGGWGTGISAFSNHSQVVHRLLLEETKYAL